MSFVPVKVDRGLREHMEFRDKTFPVDVWADRYDTFVDKTLNCHWHPEFEFGVLACGSLDYYINGTHMRLHADDCVFVNANTMHMATQAKGTQNAVIYGVAFPASLFVANTGSTVYQKYFEPVIGKPIQGFVIPRGDAAGREVARLIREVYGLDSGAFGYELHCLSLLHTLWSTSLAYINGKQPGLLAQTAGRKDETRAKDILSYIHGHYAESITIADIARHASVSRSECFRCFKRFTGKNPMEYVIEYRLACAAKLLMETGLPVTEVGAACGFGSTSYFGKLFRACYGCSPSQYRSVSIAQKQSTI